jgi:hypothetical protein
MGIVDLYYLTEQKKVPIVSLNCSFGVETFKGPRISENVVRDHFFFLFLFQVRTPKRTRLRPKEESKNPL